jgi:hypothetical protein
VVSFLRGQNDYSILQLNTANKPGSCLAYTWEVRKTVVVSVRMPEQLRDRIAKQAEKDVRSASQEIVWLLNYALETLERDKPTPRRE